MKIKILLFLSLFILVSLSLSEKDSSSTQVLTSEESFKISIKKNKSSFVISININERSYIYSEYLSLKGDKKNIKYNIIGRKELISDDFFGESIIYKNNIELIIPDYDKYIGKILYLSYQGCLENVLCYPKITKKIKATKDKNSLISFDFL